MITTIRLYDLELRVRFLENEKDVKTFTIKDQQGIVVYDNIGILADWSSNGWTWINESRAPSKVVLDVIDKHCQSFQEMIKNHER